MIDYHGNMDADNRVSICWTVRDHGGEYGGAENIKEPATTEINEYDGRRAESNKSWSCISGDNTIDDNHNLSLSTYFRQDERDGHTANAGCRLECTLLHLAKKRMGEEDPGAFAGIFQVSGSDLITFRDVCDKVRLCFELPNDRQLIRAQTGQNRIPKV